MPTKYGITNEIIKGLRLGRNLSLQDLADAVGMSKSSVYDLERGRNKFSEKTLKLYSDYFNVTSDYLIGKQTMQLQQRGLTNSDIELILQDSNFQLDIKRKALFMITMIKEKEDMEAVVSLIVYMLNKEGIDYDQELRKKYSQFLIDSDTNN